MESADSVDSNSMFFMLDHKDAFLKRIVEYNGFSYVDKKSGNSSFDCDEFITFLKYASGLPEDISEASNLYYWGLEPCDVLLKDQICNGIGNMHYESIVSLRGDYVDLGFPVGTEMGSGVISADNSYMIIFLAAMQGISGELYESAAVDGAGGIKSFLKITVPMLGSNIMFVSILATINSFKVFDQVNTMVTDAGPGRSASVLVYAIYYYAFRKQNIGKASAIAVVLFLIIFVISMVQMRLKKKVTV